MFENLVINGGLMKLLSVTGCIKYFEENNITNEFKNYYATSAGCIISLLMILDYKYSEIYDFITNFDFKKILKPDITNFLSGLYLVDYDKPVNFVKALLTFKGYDENITMLELYEKTQKKFTITCISLGKKQVHYYNYLNQPNLPIYLSILMSSCVFGIFKPVFWEGDLYLDGGMCDNLPLSQISFKDYDKTLCIKTSAKTNVKDFTPDFVYKNIFEYMYDIMCFYENYNINHQCDNIINIKLSDSKDNSIFSCSFLETKEDYDHMINIAYEETRMFFENKTKEENTKNL